MYVLLLIVGCLQNACAAWDDQENTWQAAVWGVEHCGLATGLLVSSQSPQNDMLFGGQTHESFFDLIQAEENMCRERPKFEATLEPLHDVVPLNADWPSVIMESNHESKAVQKGSAQSTQVLPGGVGGNDPCMPEQPLCG